MKLPADVAVISPEKLRGYILSPTHPDGRSKAAYLGHCGYLQTDWRRLEHDLRAQHLILDAAPGRPSLYGAKYEIVGVLVGPNGATSRIRTVWIVRHGEAFPRFVTLIPEE